MFSIDEIGFYTLTNERAKHEHENLERCEMILTSFCNFSCPYCRGVKSYSRNCIGNIDHNTASFVINYWGKLNLRSIRFSGGEPTLYPKLIDLIKLSKDNGIKNIAVSSNGSSDRSVYEDLLIAGVNDFSISLDACCAEDAARMAGRSDFFDTLINNIKYLSERTYVTVGIVLTSETAKNVSNVVVFADSLGVSDIRIISAAQYNGGIFHLENIPAHLLNKFPILKYRVNNLIDGRNVRGLMPGDSPRCYLVEDDYAVAGRWHFPCVIHMREGGEPIGEVGENMQAERLAWSKNHDSQNDPICLKNCLDCLIDYNNCANKYRENNG